MPLIAVTYVYSPATVETLFAQDPFAVENLIESATFHEWTPVMGTFAS